MPRSAFESLEQELTIAIDTGNAEYANLVLVDANENLLDGEIDHAEYIQLQQQYAAAFDA